MDECRRIAGYARTLLLDPWRHRWLVWLVVGAFFAVSVYRYTWVTLPNLDVSWLMLAAERMLAGGKYFEDFFEVNWPMAIMVYCPGILTSRLLGIDPYSGLLILTFLLIGGSVLVVEKLLHRVIPAAPVVTGVLVVAYAWVLLFPHHRFAQREHLAIMLFLPFVIAAAGRGAGKPLDSRFAEVGIAAVAAVGALIKPHFILLPAAIFLFRLMQQRSWRVFRHLDLVTFVAIGAVYLAVVILLFPGWIEVAKWAVQLYSAYNAAWYGLLRNGGMGLALAVLVLIGSRYVTFPSAAKALILQLAITAGVASVIYVLQRKGWGYQFYPAKVALTLLVPAFALSFLAAATLPRTPLRPIHAALAIPLIAVAGLLPVARDIWRDWHRLVDHRTSPVVRAVRASDPGAAIFVFSADVGDAFPMVFVEKRGWASRFPSLWLVPGIVAQRAAARTPSQRTNVEVRLRRTIEMTLEDFRRNSPKLVLVRLEANKRWLPEDFDILSFYRADPDFEAIWRRYRSRGRVGRFEVFVLAD